MTPKLLLAGGSGFLGQTLATYLQDRGFEVVILSRSPGRSHTAGRTVAWNARSLGPWQAELEGATAVVNLTGKSVNCRYHASNRREILQSRLDSTRVLGEAIGRCTLPPRIWLNSSTATIYKHTLGRAHNENGEVGATPEARDGFSVDVALAWEREFAGASTPRTRKVAMRTAMVLGQGANSVFPVLRRLAQFGLGGTMGSGAQYVSWIHEADFCRAVEWLVTHEDLEGPVNIAAPNPLLNREMMRCVRQVCGVPFGLPAPAWMLEIGAFFLRTETELLLKSRRVVPRLLLESGFEFEFPTFREACAGLTASAVSN
jgi:uncharacterized protein (TIGR01777 family)